MPLAPLNSAAPQLTSPKQWCCTAPRACSGSNEPLDSLPSLHAAPVTAMRYSEPADAVISTDAKGVIEYWSASTYQQPGEGLQFSFKLDTGGAGRQGCLAACRSCWRW